MWSYPEAQKIPNIVPAVVHTGRITESGMLKGHLAHEQGQPKLHRVLRAHTDSRAQTLHWFC